MAAKSSIMTYQQVSADVLKGTFRPIYVLYGEESYYIDKLEEMISQHALSEDERDFNYNLYYGIDVDIRSMISVCKRYPMMAERQVVVLREAQNVRANDLDLLKFYAENAVPTTVLVVCVKSAELKGKEFLAELKKHSEYAIVESKPIPEWTLPKVIKEYVASTKHTIDDKSVSMLMESVGSNLTRLFGEIDKLRLVIGAGMNISPELVERNIGISKDYNMFELEDAVLTRNNLKINKIINYFEKNKAMAQVAFTPIVYRVFVKILMIRTSADRSEETLMKRTEERSSFRLKKFIQGAGKYSTMDCVKAISAIRRFDAKSKGIGSRQSAYDLMRDFAYQVVR